MKNDKVSIAYPNFDANIPFTAPRNTHKWINAVKDMYYQVHKGIEKQVALDKVMSGWNEMEKLDFKNWLKFYEENAHKKYSEADEAPTNIKIAQIGYWEDANRSGYFVPVHREPEKNSPLPNIRDIDFAMDPSTNPGIKADEKRDIIEKQRNKIVSRLDSAEKLLRSQEGQLFAGKEFESLMHIIYELKKKIHTVNKISTSNKLYKDIIVREASILNKKGFDKASQFLFKIAEDVPLTATPSNPPTVSEGLPGTIPGSAPGQTPEPNNTPSQLGDGEEKVDEGMEGFLKGLDGKKDQQTSDDIEIVEEPDDNWVVEAQAAPAPEAQEENIEVQEDPAEAAGEPAAKPADESVQGSDFDQKANQLFQNLTIADVVQKLEDTTKYYKTREMPRQLAWIDMMLDHLGLAPFFPTLAEATNKALDSNQYILTRLEDITSRLRGTVQTNEIDLKGQNPVPSSPELESARNQLQQEVDKEKARKQMKKEQENAQVAQQAKVEPELEVEEDLGGPVETTNAVPAPATPPAPAAPQR